MDGWMVGWIKKKRNKIWIKKQMDGGWMDKKLWMVRNEKLIQSLDVILDGVKKSALQMLMVGLEKIMKKIWMVGWMDRKNI